LFERFKVSRWERERREELIDPAINDK